MKQEVHTDIVFGPNIPDHEFLVIPFHKINVLHGIYNVN